MKSGIIISMALLLSLIFSSSTVFPNGQYDDDDCKREMRDERGGRRHHRPKYVIGNYDVFFDGRKVEGASASSFKILKYGYAKDAWSVYYRGAKIKGASESSFKVLGDGYAKDTWNVYYRGAKIKGASESSFEVLGDGYAKDTWSTYYMGRKIGR